jgi:hypothetical protein
MRTSSYDQPHNCRTYLKQAKSTCLNKIGCYKIARLLTWKTMSYGHCHFIYHFFEVGIINGSPTWILIKKIGLIGGRIYTKVPKVWNSL